MKKYLTFFAALVVATSIQAGVLRFLPKNKPNINCSANIKIDQEYAATTEDHYLIERFNHAIENNIAIDVFKSLAPLLIHYAHIALAFPQEGPTAQLLVTFSHDPGVTNVIQCSSRLMCEIRKDILSLEELNDAIQFDNAIGEITRATAKAIDNLLEDTGLMFEENSTISFRFDLFMAFKGFID